MCFLIIYQPFVVFRTVAVGAVIEIFVIHRKDLPVPPAIHPRAFGTVEGSPKAFDFIESGRVCLPQCGLQFAPIA